ncbi:MAG TPA: pilus assembly protein N-terminal domain-containing protein, partial [Bryobacteraceae bacterium]|nr:pilus assembly protein N-terminal domain-containing protein [Bryobacteraceae bacterium]
MSVQRRSRLSLFALFLAGAAGLAGQAADLPDDLFVTAGKAVLVDSKVPIDRVAVGSAEIAEADATSPYEVMLSGKAPGETSLIVWQKGGGKLFFDVTVRASRFLDNNRIETVRRVIAEELPGQKIAATLENNVIFLRGTAKDLTSSRRAAAIAGTMGKVVNLLYVDVPKEDEQILLKVRFASVDRSISSNLGLNIYSLGATNTVGRVTTGQFSPPTVTYTPSTGSAPASATATLSDALNLFFFRPDLNLGSTIKALEDRGLLQVLAEPNVLAEDGKQASFLAGGEYPYPVVQGGVGGSPSAVT